MPAGSFFFFPNCSNQPLGDSSIHIKFLCIAKRTWLVVVRYLSLLDMLDRETQRQGLFVVGHKYVQTYHQTFFVAGSDVVFNPGL